MSYKHGDWYCGPMSENEAREIILRAVSSGAVLDEDLGGIRWDDCDAWGVLNGRAYTGGIGNASQSFYGKKEYTIEELRQKFPLLGEREEEPKQWRGPEDGLPPVGTVCEAINYDLDNNFPERCKIKYSGTHVVVYDSDSCVDRIGRVGLGLVEFRPLRTERERWVEAASKIACKDFSIELAIFAAGEIYDAMQSGQLKAPEVTDGK